MSDNDEKNDTVGREIQINVSDGIQTSDSIVLQSKGPGREGIRSTDYQGRSAGADLEGEGNVTRRIIGSPPQGEEATEDVCRRVIERLNRDGAKYGLPYYDSGEPDVDCMSKDSERTLRIQVVRGDTREFPWKELARSEASLEHFPVQKATNMLWEAIRRKAQRIPPTQQQELHLAIDASLTPDLVLDKVIKILRRDYGHEISKLRFAGIWIAGPSTDLTVRI